jgi:hypothetical protein
MRIAGFILLIMITACWTAPAAAGQSRLTSIANADCIFAPIGDEAGEEEDQLKTCSGLGGAQVLVNALGTRLRIGFRWPKGPSPQKAIWVTEAWSAGTAVDWRGVSDSKGFKPYAAIIRMKLQKEDTPAAGDQVLAVIRVGRGIACVMGAVDVGANRNANRLAHALADARSSFNCGRDKPTVGGVTTAAARKIAKGIVEQ